MPHKDELTTKPEQSVTSLSQLDKCSLIDKDSSEEHDEFIDIAHQYTELEQTSRCLPINFTQRDRSKFDPHLHEGGRRLS